LSAKQKRPFFMFVAVAAVCCMVLVTGVRSKASEFREPEHSAVPNPTSGRTLEPLPDATVRSAPGPGAQTQRDAGPSTTAGSSGDIPHPATFDGPRSDAGPTDDGGSEPDLDVIDDLGFDLPDAPPPFDDDPGPGEHPTGPPDDKGGNSAGRHARGHSNAAAKHQDKKDPKDEDGGGADGEDDVTSTGGHPTQPLGEDESPDQQDEVGTPDQQDEDAKE
jgi:hypothetical protein